VFLGMAVLEEFVIIVLCLGTGLWTIEAIKEEKKLVDSEGRVSVPLEDDGSAWKPPVPVVV
jgi:hypothetical protein